MVALPSDRLLRSWLLKQSEVGRALRKCHLNIQIVQLPFRVVRDTVVAAGVFLNGVTRNARRVRVGVMPNLHLGTPIDLCLF